MAVGLVLLSFLPSGRSAKAAVVPSPDPQPAPPPGGLGGQTVSLVRYLMQTEVHTYAFSVAANAILSLFPFIVMMFTISRRVFHSQAMENVIGDMLRYFLPAGQDFVVKNMSIVAHARGGVQLVSLVVLLISSTGVFLPLEVALNQVWGVKKNRSYLRNQLVSLSLAFGVGVLALGSIAATAGQNVLLTAIFFGHTDNFAFRFIGHSVLRLSAVFMSITLFFLILTPALAILDISRKILGHQPLRRATFLTAANAVRGPWWDSLLWGSCAFSATDLQASRGIADMYVMFGADEHQPEHVGLAPREGC